MRKRKIISLVNLLISGFIAIIVSTFFAAGTIAENYTDKTFVAPEFFIVLVIWGIGGLFVLLHFYKNLVSYFVFSLIITWVSIPLGISLGFIWL
ncbi:sphingosine N-acyltransferase lac1 [Oceanobacillus picturae]|uniref:Sphingosine N-acyltransferase lac1 n=1 Tax=Oceanobacillus picturae TaxID=171693 RepID=W9AAX3_9BACI|nr:hypothetical protein [Oceanobacillus picturae]GAQ16311.1 sphingosine N-acyltransferase lac1 [Oceanobacillus picturae]CDO02613.1 hypothetical protein BN988_01086 [Oceanobacillus picturae]